MVIPKSNRVICFVGENGCNKTSLISLLYHLIRRNTQSESPSDAQDIYFGSTSDVNFSKGVNTCISEIQITADDKVYTSCDGIIRNTLKLTEDDKSFFQGKFQFFNSLALTNFYRNDWLNALDLNSDDVVSRNVLLFRPSQRSEVPYFERDPKQAVEQQLAGSSNVIGRRKFPYRVESGIERVENYFIEVILDYLIDLQNQKPLEPIYGKFMKILSSIDESFSEISITKFPNKGIRSTNLPSLKSLSSGQSDWLVTAISILVQMVEIAPKLAKSVDDISGVVFIDEVDKNYHPKFQEEFMPWLLETFPNIQFVITTHSPYLVRSLDENALVVKLPDGEVLNHDFSYWSIEEVSHTIFGKDLGFTKKVQEELKLFEELLLTNKGEDIKAEYKRLSSKSESLERKVNQLVFTFASAETLEILHETD